MSQDNQVWLINLHDQDRFVDVLSTETAGCTIDEARNIMCQSLDVLLQEITSLPDWDFHNHNIGVMSSQNEQKYDHLVQTQANYSSRVITVRSKRRKIHNIIVEPIQNWIGCQRSSLGYLTRT